MAPTATNVRVAVRCRPLSKKEHGRGCDSVVNVQEQGRLTLSQPEASGKGGDPEVFTFDHAYGPSSSQEQVYGEIGAPILDRAFDGVNSTLFAYGQTGSGKTHSMMGADTGAAAFEDGSDMAGVIPRLTQNLFSTVDTRKDTLAADGTTCEIQVTLTYLEIYNEEIHDLLNPQSQRGGAKSLKVRESPTDGIYVEGLCELVVTSAGDVGKLVSEGNAVRRVAATQMNERSSRSHSVLAFRVDQQMTSKEADVETHSTLSAKLNLVDLAGSERASKTGATGSTLLEGAKINLSLMTLGTAINALSEGKFVPYRNSKLTYLLKESLGGNAATVMLAAISPADYNVDETHQTLKYAQRAKRITNAVVKNEDVHQRVVRELKEEIERLREQLLAGAGTTTGPGAGDGASDLERAALEEKLAELQRAQQKSWTETAAERERLTHELEQERSANVGRALGGVIDEVKARKMQILQELQELQNTKHQLSLDAQKERKRSTAAKASLAKDMTQYEQLQKRREQLLLDDSPDSQVQADEVAHQMAAQIQKVEAANKAYALGKANLKAVNKKLATLEDQVKELRAELVASTDMLKSNDQLRKMIQEEEREKWQADNAELLERERRRLAEETKMAAEADVTAARKTAEEMQGHLDAATASREAAEERRRMVEERLAQVEEENRALKSSLEIVQLEASEASGEAKTASYRVEELEALVAEGQDALQAAQAAESTAQQDLRASADRVAALEEQVRLLETERPGPVDDAPAAVDPSDSSGDESSLEDEHMEGFRVREGFRLDDGGSSSFPATPVDGLAPAADPRVEEHGYRVFRHMVGVLEADRVAMQRKLHGTQQLLAQATKDLLRVLRANGRLEKEVARLGGEPPASTRIEFDPLDFSGVEESKLGADRPPVAEAKTGQATNGPQAKGQVFDEEMSSLVRQQSYLHEQGGAGLQAYVQDRHTEEKQDLQRRLEQRKLQRRASQRAQEEQDEQRRQQPEQQDQEQRQQLPQEQRQGEKARPNMADDMAEAMRQVVAEDNGKGGGGGGGEPAPVLFDKDERAARSLARQHSAANAQAYQGHEEHIKRRAEQERHDLRRRLESRWKTKQCKPPVAESKAAPEPSTPAPAIEAASRPQGQQPKSSRRPPPTTAPPASPRRVVGEGQEAGNDPGLEMARQATAQHDEAKAQHELLLQQQAAREKGDLKRRLEQRRSARRPR